MKKITLLFVLLIFLSCFNDNKIFTYDTDEDIINEQPNVIELQIENGIGFSQGIHLENSIHIDSLRIEITEYPSNYDFGFGSFWICHYNPEWYDENYETSTVCLNALSYDPFSLNDSSVISITFEFEVQSHLRYYTYFTSYIYTFDWNPISGKVFIYYR